MMKSFPRDASLMDGPAAHEAEHPQWVQALSDLHPKYGGISSAVPALARALAGRKVGTSIAAFCRSGESYTPSDLGNIAVDFWPSKRAPWFMNQSLRSMYRERLREVDGVHIHGLWQQSSIASSHAAIAAGKPYVVSAHGMLDPWALRNHRVRKQIYSLLIERGILRRAACLHALTRAEATAYRTYAGDCPIAIIPNGVDAPQTLSPQVFLENFPQVAGRRVILFLGRIHPKKGLDLLIKAWLAIEATHSDSVLVIAGPDDEGTLAPLEALCEERHDRVVFTGMLGPELKWSALAAAELFVLPSHSEGLSMGVLEAMSAGKPVLLTPQCNMPQVADNGAGWLVHPHVGELTEALRFVLARSQEQNATTGACGRRLIEREYTWNSVARRMADVYRWVQNGFSSGSLPTSCEVVL